MELIYDEAVRLLWIAVDERGYNFVYPDGWRDDNRGCLYVNEAEQCPGCIIGYLLHLFGISIEALSEIEGASAADAIDRLGIATIPRTVDLLITAQSLQDGGHPWGESVSVAIDPTLSRWND